MFEKVYGRRLTNMTCTHAYRNTIVHIYSYMCMYMRDSSKWFHDIWVVGGRTMEILFIYTTHKCKHDIGI